MLILVKPTFWETWAAGLKAGCWSCAKAAKEVVNNSAKAKKKSFEFFMFVGTWVLLVKLTKKTGGCFLIKNKAGN